MKKDRTRKIMISHEEVEVKLFMEVFAVLLILAIGFGIFYEFEPTITGLIIGLKQFEYEDTISLEFNESSEYVWNLGNTGDLKAVRVSGTVENEGSAKIYLVNGNASYLIFDSNKLDQKEILNKITGFVVADDEEKGKEPNHPPVWNSSLDSFILNGTLNLDLNNYFNDKDEDLLIYSATELKTNDLEILLESGTLTINNKNNSEGNRTLSITASDNKTSKKKNVKLILINVTINQTPIINETNQTINETQSKTIDINLEYEVGSVYDVDDNGIETKTGIVDMTVYGTKFNWDVDENKLCALWETFSFDEEESTTVCHGSSDCCSLVNLAPTRTDWDETFYSYYGLYGAGLSNLISAQVVYADYNLSVENPYVDIVYSDKRNLSAVFYTGLIAFDDICTETCSLFGFNDTSYKLVIEVNNTKINLNQIDYVVEKEVENNAPVLIKDIGNISINKNRNYTLNLSEYFVDLDGDELSYIYSEINNVDISFEGDLAYVVPNRDFTGSEFTFITANDGIESKVGNVFEIKVLESGYKGEFVTKFYAHSR
jgi:hypothetical protein